MSDHQQELRDLGGRIAQDHPTQSAGRLPGSWDSLRELGLSTVGTPESLGGAGGSLIDVGTVIHELARHGQGSPLAVTAIANWATAKHRSVDAASLSTLVIDLKHEVHAGALSHTFTAVPWARHADSLLVVGRKTSWLVDLRDKGVRIVPVDDLAAEPRDTVVLDEAPVVAVRHSSPAHIVETRLALLTTRALQGALTGAYDLTRRYVSTREQFGKPLVKIPAVATNLALLKTSLIELTAAVERAEILFHAKPDTVEGAMAVAAARILAGHAAGQGARISHQLHGAMGVTAEYPLHQLTRRLWAWRDSERTTDDWSRQLGNTVLDLGEPELWDDLTGHVTGSPLTVPEGTS